MTNGIYAAIAPQLSAHLRHAAAQSAMPTVSQLSAHRRHTSLHARQTRPCSSLPRIMKSVQVAQIWMQSSISFTCARSTCSPPFSKQTFASD